MKNANKTAILLSLAFFASSQSMGLDDNLTSRERLVEYYKKEIARLEQKINTGKGGGHTELDDVAQKKAEHGNPEDSELNELHAKFTKTNAQALIVWMGKDIDDHNQFRPEFVEAVKRQAEETH